MKTYSDSEYSHLAWTNLSRRKGGLGEMKIPILADKTHQISKAYGVLKEDEGIAFRGLFLIDPKGKQTNIYLIYFLAILWHSASFYDILNDSINFFSRNFATNHCQWSSRWPFRWWDSAIGYRSVFFLYDGVERGIWLFCHFFPISDDK